MAWLGELGRWPASDETAVAADQLTYEAAVAQIPPYFSEIRALLEQSPIAKTPEGYYCLANVLTIACLYRPLVMMVDHLRPSFLEKIGGKPHSPYYRLDLVGCEANHFVTNALIATLARPLRLFVEEKDSWLLYDSLDHSASALPFQGVVDPLDESTDLIKRATRQNPRSSLHASTGVILADAGFHPVAGAVANLTDARVFYFESQAKHFLLFNDHRLTLEEIPSPKVRLHTGPLSFAMLESRSSYIAGTRFEWENFWVAKTFGGWGVLELAFNTGSLDLMLCPRGQIDNEAVIWGPNGEAAGLAVIDLEGKPIDFAIPFSRIKPGEKDRQTMLITHQDYLPRVLPYLPELNQRRSAISRY